MWIWWYDHEGCIQSEGINFVQDFPSFAVLLYALQRFSLIDWGFNTMLDPCAPFRHGQIMLNEKSQPVKISQDVEMTFEDTILEIDYSHKHSFYSSYGIIGRGTQVVPATVKGTGENVVLKIYNPEIIRDSEVDIIQRAVEMGGKNPNIAGHLPQIVCSMDFNYSTGTIRGALGITHNFYNRAITPRTQRCIAFKELLPITSLVAEEFTRAWVECVKCE